jgi:hypothetical protein
MKEVQIVNREVTLEEKSRNGQIVPLSKMMARVKSEPKLEMIYSGIKEKSLGIVFGCSKSGKTMFCENLGMSIAAGADSYLGLPIKIDNRRVLFYSFEEFYSNRTERNCLQSSALGKFGHEWLDKYMVVDEKMPRYLASNDDWKALSKSIKSCNPGIVFLDSLTHMYQGGIEDSATAQEVMKKLRNLLEETQTTIVVIHHSHKLYDKAISLDTIAGSRVVAQELDFMIGMNRTSSGVHYIKDVAFRYAPCKSEVVRTFEIDDRCWLNITGESDEITVLTSLDGRRDEMNKLKILQYIRETQLDGFVTTKMLDNRFIPTGEMSHPTINNNLRKLLAEQKIVKQDKGQYRAAA